MDILELNHLTEAERDLILSVVQRDEDLQKKELARIEKLKAEIKLLKMKGALKPGMNAEKSCARCRKPFGWLFDKGETCIKCEQKVCEECHVQQKESNKWFCLLCQKQKELDAMSGAWFYEKFRKSKRSKKTNKCVTGTDLVRSSFKKRSHAEMSESSVYGVKQSLSSRKHGSSPEADEESSDTQSMEAQSPRYIKKPDFNDAAFPKDAEKIMLLDLMGGPTVATVHEGDNNVSLEPAVQVQRIHTHRFSDSSSEGASVPSSPQFSHRTESEYPASESINSSFRSTSAMSSDGQYTMVTDNNSVISGISTAPPSMHQSPKLNSRGRTSYTNRMPAQEYSVSDIAVAKRLAADQTSKDSIHAINPDSSPIHRQTVKVSSRGRTVSSSSSEGDELLASSLQQGKLREVMAVGAVVHATYSSGSESSRTVQDKHGQHSAPEVDQTLPSDLSSVQDVDHSSDLSSRKVTHSSYTGSVPSMSVTDKSLAELEAKEEDDNIDDLVDSFKNKPQARSHSNLMSPFSSSVESVASIYSEAGEGNFGKIPVTGEIQFGLDYNYKTNVLEIHIKQCKDIAAVDAKKKRSDPYVKTYLLPDRTKSGKKKTRVRKHTVNPVFNEIIKYHISKSEVETRTLWVTIWHNDTFGRNDFLGEVTLPLDYYEFKDRTPKWYTLQERAPVQTSLLTYKGDFNVALKYITADNVSGRKVKGKSGNKGELLVLVKQARNLTAVRSNGTSDPFCKGYLLPEKGKGGKQKSPVIKKDCNPQWNHTFVFEDVGWEELRERTLEITIWDHDRFTSNDFLGGVRLGLGTGRSFSHDVEWSDSRGEEISVWQSMLDRPNTWIEVTLLLRPNMNSRTPSL